MNDPKEITFVYYVVVGIMVIIAMLLCANMIGILLTGYSI